MRHLRWLGLTLGALALAGGAAWLLSTDRPAPPALDQVIFSPGQVRLVLDQAHPLERLTILDSGHGPVADLRLAGVVRRHLHAALDWRPGRDYEFVLLTSQGHSLRRRARAPATGDQDLEVSLLVPYDSRAAAGGQHQAGAAETYRAAVPSGGSTTCALILRSHLDRPGMVRAEVVPRGPVRLVDSDLPSGARLIGDGRDRRLSFTRRLTGTGEVHALVFRIQTRLETEPGDEPGLEARLSLEMDGRTRQYQRTVRLNVLTPAEMASRLEVLANRLPAASSGLVEDRAQAETLYFRPPLFKAVTRWFGVQEAAMPYWVPYTYQSLTLRNNSRDNLSLLINAKTLAQDRDQTPPAFYPPDLFTGTLRDMSVVVSASLLPGETARVAVPVFVNSPPLPGQYRRLVTITPMAGTQPIKTLESPLYVRAMNWNAFLFTLAAVVSALIGFAVLAWNFRRLLAGLKIRWVVIIALFGSLSFVGVNLPLRVFGSLIHGLLGPFSVLVIGLFNDLLYFSLLVALVRLIPHPGVVALSTLVRYLLSIMITGGFQITDLVFLGSSIAVKETALYLAGVTRRREAFVWSWPHLVGLAALLALGDAFLNAASLYVHIVVFRLYFADWYIMLNVVMNGVIYTSLAVLLGKRFSDRLVWAEE